MKSIEVTTAQKVIIRYDLAEVKDRILAYLIDMIVLGTFLGILLSIIISTFIDRGDVFTMVMIFVALPIFLFYTLLSELLMNGRTLGKRALNLKVIRADGGVPRVEDLVIRWVFRWVDIYTSFGAVAALLISAGKRSQRLGGLLSNTLVVRTKGKYNIRIEDLERLKDSFEEEEPMYPAAVCFAEDEMLLLKQLLSRYTSHPNRAHRNLMIETSAAIATRMDLKEIPKNHRQFLQTVLRDYIKLTR